MIKNTNFERENHNYGESQSVLINYKNLLLVYSHEIIYLHESSYQTHYWMYSVSMLVQEQSIESLLLVRIYGINQSLYQGLMKA